MEIVQLGLFSSVYNWVYNKILDPMWEWVSGLLSSGFKYLAKIIPNVIGTVMDTLFGKVIDILLEFYFSRWYVIQSAILLLLDCIEDCFNAVSGLTPVYIGGENGSARQAVPLLFAVFNQKTVQNAMWTMIVVGFSICFAMAIIAVARNFFELGSEKTKPVTHIIRMTAKSLLYLVLAPMIAAALILLSQAVLRTIDRAVSFGSEEKTSIARIIFCISSLDAVDTDAHKDGKEYNISYDKGPSKASLTDKYRKKFYYKDDSAIPNYANLVTVADTFVFRGFDYVVGIGCAIFFTVIMCMVLAVFIGRIFDVIVLIIIEPFFIGMMPFDDGEYYKRWLELFIGKLFQGFGSVIAMRVYLMILEQIFSGQVRFSSSASVGARLQDYLMMLLFAMGGGVAVRHIGPLVTGILSQSAATGEQMSAYEGLRVGQTIASRELGVTKAYLTADASRLGKLAGGAGNLAGMAAGSLFERFNGRRGPGGPGIGGPGGGSGDENPGKFENKSRPQAGALPVVAGIGGGRMSASKATGSAVKGALPAGGAAKQGGGFAGAPGKGAGAGASQSMQDILSGNNAGGIGSGWEILNDDGSNANNGAFNGAAHENMQDGNNAGASQSMQDILSGNNAGEIGSGWEILQDDGSNANNGAFDSSEWVNVENVNNAGDSQSMQDILSGNNAGEIGQGWEILNDDGSNANNGAFDSSEWVYVENVNNAGPAQSMQDIVSGSNNIGQPAGGAAGGNNNGAFDSSGWVNVENINDVGASRSMQDIISGNDSLGDMSGGSFDASLNNVGSLNDEDDE